MCRAPMPKPSRIVQDRERRIHRLPVHQRLAHAHEHDVRGAKRRVEQRDLAHLTRDLVRLEVARESHAPVAQNAHWSAHPACDEMQNVRRSPSGIATVSMASPSCRRKRNFSRPVGRLLARGDLEARHRERSLERRAERLRQLASSPRTTRPGAATAGARPDRRDTPALRRDRRTRASAPSRRVGIEIEKVRSLTGRCRVSTNW